MNILEKIVHLIDGLNEVIGRAVAWLTLVMVLVCFVVVVMRYAFGTGLVWIQETYIWAHALVFLLGAGYTFLHNGHVRVDLVYGGLSARGRAWINIFGTLVFLAPWLLVMALYSSRFVLSSWASAEVSPQPGGLPGLYLLKSTLWVFIGIMALQGFSLLAKSVLFLSGREAYSPVSDGGH